MLTSKQTLRWNEFPLLRCHLPQTSNLSCPSPSPSQVPRTSKVPVSLCLCLCPFLNRSLSLSSLRLKTPHTPLVHSKTLASHPSLLLVDKLQCLIEPPQHHTPTNKTQNQSCWQMNACSSSPSSPHNHHPKCPPPRQEPPLTKASIHGSGWKLGS